MSMEAFHPLRPFAEPFGAASPVTLVAGLARSPDVLRAEFRLGGELDLIDLPRLPIPREGRRRHELWRRTCFECFFAVAGDEGYVEVNLCTDHCWNVYRFSGYRHGMAEASCLEATVEVTTTTSGLTLVAAFPLSDLAPDTSPLQAALSAVLLHRDGEKSYWALTHCADEPDFHQRAAFVVDLPPSLPWPPSVA